MNQAKLNATSMAPTPAATPVDGSAALKARYVHVRAQTEHLAAPLSPEDCQAQSMPDASPVKWHLAHVTWFFETFVLERFETNYVPFNHAYRVLFNSYYNAVGDKHPRAQRGALTRPNFAEVMQWRQHVDTKILALLDVPHTNEFIKLVVLGLNHEQQHQELLLTDVKHLLSCNPLEPKYLDQWPPVAVAPVQASWIECSSGLKEIGASGAEFSFDNETPKHRIWLEPYALMNRLVTHGEWLDFMLDGGYTDQRWWLSAGWDWVTANAIQSPLYWYQTMPDTPPTHGWRSFTLHGSVPIDANTPITHISYFEADAFARWKSASDPFFAGARLPTEAEWEAAVTVNIESHRLVGNFAESGALHPLPVPKAATGLLQALGDVWQWTQSSYQAYPGFHPWEGAVGEYNGKFMVNQYVLRGGSCATPADHIRATYRNFFPSDARWQFTGLRLARTQR